MTARASILAALPGPDEPPVTAREVWKRIGMYAPSSVRQVLLELTVLGVLEQFKEPHRRAGHICGFRRARTPA